MKAKLLRPCVALWACGVLGMWFVRAVLVLEPNALVFRVAAGLWILGGLGYTVLGLLCLEAGEGPGEQEGAAAPADLSAWIRRK